MPPSYVQEWGLFRTLFGSKSGEEGEEGGRRARGGGGEEGECAKRESGGKRYVYGAGRQLSKLSRVVFSLAPATVFCKRSVVKPTDVFEGDASSFPCVAFQGGVFNNRWCTIRGARGANKKKEPPSHRVTLNKKKKDAVH